MGKIILRLDRVMADRKTNIGTIWDSLISIAMCGKP